MKLPRIMLAAGSSGSGKTVLTCGLLQALLLRNIKPASFKCGPDYIDPMFHRRVLGTVSGNLDLFFTDGERIRYLLGSMSEDCDLAVIEGVMGYYDGIGGISLKASSYDLACETETPVIFIVNCRGMSSSLAAYLQGFLHYRENSRIKGVILNRISKSFYSTMKNFLEKETGISVVGYVPEIKECSFDSRHLGLVLPEEIPEFQKKLRKLAGVLEESLDMEAILKIAEAAPAIDGEKMPDLGAEAALAIDGEKMPDLDGKAKTVLRHTSGKVYPGKRKLRIGVARDEAFCFIYSENLRLLEKMGAELLFFSPMHDQKLLERLDGLILYGGYPELHAKELSENLSMRNTLYHLIKFGLPVLAECGGFLYLQEKLEDTDGNSFPMLGILKGKGYHTAGLSRFGYITLSEQRIPGIFPADFQMTAHEFHYYDSTECGDAFLAKKPFRDKSWNCIYDDGQIFAGFPHFYYYGNPKLPEMFLERCKKYRLVHVK